MPLPKEAGKIHYLKSLPKPSSSSSKEEWVERLEKKIDNLEKEFRAAQTSASKSEILPLIQNLEKRFQEVLHSFLSARSSGSNEEFEIDEFGMDPALVKKVKPFFNFLYYNYWRVSVKGMNQIPNEGRGLIVSNHSGTLPYDGSMIAASIINEHTSRKDVRFLVEDFVYHFPFLGTFIYRTGGVRACPENAERLLETNHLVVVFPEGIKGIGKHYKNRYRLQRFGRGGFIKLALRTGSPIIPTAVIGAEEIHPLIYKSTILARAFGIPYIPVTPSFPLLGPLGLVPLPSKWTIQFGEPIDFAKEYGPEAAEDQLLVNKLSEVVREKIQQMIFENLKNRRSIWFG